MVDPVEIELKLEFEPADREQLLAAMVGAASGATTRQLCARYYDTPDLALSKAGVTLRIRHDGEASTQTIKTMSANAAGLFVRGEWERPLAGDKPEVDGRDGPLAAVLDPASLERLTPIFMVEVERVSGPLVRDGTEIEFAIDHGKVVAGQRSAHLCELELELRSGSPTILFDVARTIDADVPLRLGVRSKSARGYELIGGAPDGGVKAGPMKLDRSLTSGDAFAEIAGACVRHYRLNEELLLHGDAGEAVHQARVALRRLRSAFTLFAPLLKHDQRGAMLGAELRWLAHELGAVRDIDVIIPRLGGARQIALGSIREQRFAHLRSLLHTGRVRLLPIDLIEWLSDGEWRRHPGTAEALSEPARDFASRRLDKLFRRIRHDGRKLGGLDDSHRHDVRKDAKELRYAAEFFFDLYPKHKARRRLDKFLARLESLQDELGELNDMAAAPELLARLGLEDAAIEPDPKARERVIGKATDCFDALIEVKRFWRA